MADAVVGNNTAASRLIGHMADPDEDSFASPQWGPSFVASGEDPNTSVVSIGVRGFPDIQRHLRIDLGRVLTRARHLDGDRVIVHMDDLSELASGFGVDFEFDDGRLIPLPLHVDEDGRELTEDELEGLGGFADGDTIGKMPSGLGSGPVSESEAWFATVGCLRLREDVARAWARIFADLPAEDVEVSVEPFEGTESSGFVARAKVRGINLSEVDKDRGEAMTKLVEAARARGQMERER